MKFNMHSGVLALGSVCLLAPCGQCAGEDTTGLVSMVPSALPLQPSYSGGVTAISDSATTAAPAADHPPALGIFAGSPGFLLALAIAGAAAWSCRHRCFGDSVAANGDKSVRRSDYSAVNSSERDGLLSTSAPAGVATADDDSGGEEGTLWGVSESALAGTPIILAPLRILGEAIKEKVLGGTSHSRSRRRADVDDEETGGRALYDDPQENEEEARGLLQEGPQTRRDEEEDTRFQVRPKSPPRPLRTSPQSSPKRASPKRNNPAGNRSDSDEDMDDDQAAVAALMKLRPAARDSLGDDEEDDELATRPLIGSERASFLSR